MGARVRVWSFSKWYQQGLPLDGSIQKLRWGPLLEPGESTMRYARALVTGIALLAAASALSGTKADVIEEIERLDAEYQRAVAAGDTATVDRLLLDDFVLITSSGRISRKPDVLAEVGGVDTSFEINVSRDVQVRVRGDTAIVTAVLHQKGVYQGKPFDSTVRYTDTWVRDARGWRQLSGHASTYRPSQN
jgi:ketosteroid isomerase-like protein